MKKQLLVIVTISLLFCITFQVSPVSAQSNTKPSNSQGQRLVTEIKNYKNILQKEADYTQSKKANIPVSESTAIITELQSTIQKLEQLESRITTVENSELKVELDNIGVQTHVLRRIRLRRTAAILITYRDILTDYVSFYRHTSPSLRDFSLSSKEAVFNQCLEKGENSIREGSTYLSGILSQIGLISSLSTAETAQLDANLRKQMNQGKKTLDLARRELRTCPDYLKP